MEGTSFGPAEIWQSMGLVGKSVMIFLILMSVYSMSLMIERYIQFSRARKQTLRFVEAAKAFLPEHKIEELLAEGRKYPKSHLAHIYSAAIVDWHSYHKNAEIPPEFEHTMSRAVDREAVIVVQNLKRGLSGLATIGATAPFVGLFGTVVGIMNAFFSMATSGQSGIATVSGGIAEALVNTAMGLFVALPAVWGFNYFLNRVERFNAEMGNTGQRIGRLLREKDPERCMEIGEGHSLKSDINVTPLVDVMLVLLIIFMLVTPMLQTGMSVTLPKARNVKAVSEDENKVVVLVLRQAGDLYLANNLIDSKQLVQELRIRHSANPHLQLQIKADQNVRFELIRALIEAGREAGFVEVSLIAEELREESAKTSAELSGAS